MTAEVMLSVVMPALDEEDGIESAVHAALVALDDHFSGGGEVVVVNDGSTDRTAEIVRAMAVADHRVKLVEHPCCRGLGAAVRSGVAASSGRAVVYTDADEPFDLSELPRLLAPLGTSSVGVVAGYRYGRGGEGARRVVYSWVYNRLVWLVLGVRVRDVNFAAKALRREVVDSIDLRSEGSFIDAEILMLVTRAGYEIAEVGLDYRARTTGVSKLSDWSTIATILREMKALRESVRRRDVRA